MTARDSLIADGLLATEDAYLRAAPPGRLVLNRIPAELLVIGDDGCWPRDDDQLEMALDLVRGGLQHCRHAVADLLISKAR